MNEVAWRSSGPRDEGAKEEKRMLLLKTAAQMFNEAGFERTSLTDIAGRLGITKPSLYYYVKNKEAILYSISKLVLEEMKSLAKNVQNGQVSGRDQLEAYLTGYIDIILSDFGTCLVTSSKMALSEGSRKKLRADRKITDHAVREIVNNGIKDGSLDTSSPRMATAAIFGAINWMCFWYQKDGDLKIEEFTSKFLEFFMKGLEPKP
jgi:AcrR family transcriptional regulator